MVKIIVSYPLLKVLIELAINQVQVIPFRRNGRADSSFINERR
jgi:hypothetical protein